MAYVEGGGTGAGSGTGSVLVGVGFLLLQRSGGDMHTCMLVLAGWVQEQVQVKASGGRRGRFHSYGKMLYMHTQGLRWR